MSSPPRQRQNTPSSADGSEHRTSEIEISPRELKRARIIAAMTHAVSEEGVQNASITRVLGRAGIARVAFYHHFHDRDDCLIAAVESTLQRCRSQVQATHRAQAPWRAQIRAGLEALLMHFEEEPDSARLCISCSRQPSQAMKDLRRQVLGELTAAIERGRDGQHNGPGPITAESIVEGLLGVLQTRLEDTQGPRLTELTAALMSFIVLPYRGAQAAREELAQASTPSRPAGGTRAKPTTRRSARELRITYRTMRVLAAIGASPGLSNCEVAQRADITDQGQISKLLKRLRDLELIENTHNGQRRGEANAWRLTAAGRRQSAVLDHRAKRA
jgi:AcrR family transcriptional regulator